MMEVERSTYEDLLCGPPAQMEEDHGAQTCRSAADYVNKSERFRVRQRLFDRQYAQTYFSRLAALRPRALAAAAEAWPGVPVRRILELQEGQECVLSGTLYKEMRLKPSVLDEYARGRGAAQLAGAARFASADDVLVLEDDGARIRLQPAEAAGSQGQRAGAPLAVGELVTGVVAAVRGTPCGSEFRVTGMAYARPQPPAPLPDTGEDTYVVLASGLCVGDDVATADNVASGDDGGSSTTAIDPLRVSLLADYLSGMLGAPGEQRAAGRVVRLVLAGGLVHGGGGGGSNDGGTLASAVATAGSGKQQAAAVAPLRDADACLARLAALLPVDVMPGAADPSNHSLPQQPLHACLFPAAARFGSLHAATNPHELQVGGRVTLLGTSGQNVDDVHRYSTQDDRLRILENTLGWGHLVPTAPDTLTAYPFADRDPFVIESAPHVYFAGNQPEFACKQVEHGTSGARTLLVAVPSFAATGTVALVNLRTLECVPVRFDTALE